VVNALVTSVVIPRLEKLAKETYDPLSRRQTTRALGLVDEVSYCVEKSSPKFEVSEILGAICRPLLTRSLYSPSLSPSSLGFSWPSPKLNPSSPPTSRPSPSHPTPSTLPPSPLVPTSSTVKSSCCRTPFAGDASQGACASRRSRSWRERACYSMSCCRESWSPRLSSL
jgi:hypothetical protein